MMDKRVYKKTGEEISLLGLGMMRLPFLDGEDKKIDYDKAKQMLDMCYAAGVNYYDTAYGYHGGESEKFAARALAEYPRASYRLTSKLPMWLVESAADAERLLDEQLEKCGVDYFDFYLFHALNAENYKKIEQFDLWNLMDKKRREGKIKNLGFSFHDKPEVLAKICAEHTWDVAQLQLNYLDWEMQDAKTMYDILQQRGIPCIVMEPVRGGRLAELGQEADGILKAAAPQRSIASWALRWVGSLPGVLTVLSGMSEPWQVEDNLGTFSPLQPLSTAESEALEQAVELFKQHRTVPCTACRYCMPCPAGVDIPGMLALYNKCTFDGNSFQLRGHYRKVAEGERAEACIACGQCESICPQHINIIEMMQEISAAASEA